MSTQPTTTETCAPLNAERPPSRIDGKINPEYRRYYLAKRAADGLPPFKKHKQSKEYGSAYRARRIAEGRPIERSQESVQRYNQSPSGIAARARYAASEKGRTTAKRRKKPQDTGDAYAARIIGDLERLIGDLERQLSPHNLAYDEHIQEQQG